jgi:hypothetical protein
MKHNLFPLNRSLQMTLTDNYAAGNTDADESPVDERYCLLTVVVQPTSSR